MVSSSFSCGFSPSVHGSLCPGFNMHDLIDPRPIMCKALKQIRSDNNTNHPLNLCKRSGYEKDIANLMPVTLFSRQKGIKQVFAKYMLYCPFISSQ